MSDSYDDLWKKQNEVYIARNKALFQAATSKYLFARLNDQYEELLTKMSFASDRLRKTSPLSLRSTDLAVEIDALLELGDLTEKEKAIHARLEAELETIDKEIKDEEEQWVTEEKAKLAKELNELIQKRDALVARGDPTEKKLLEKIEDEIYQVQEKEIAFDDGQESGW